MNQIIAFEGMPGSGKTSVINEITKNGLIKDAIFVPQLGLPQKSKILKDNLSTSKLYLDAEINKSRRIRELLGRYKYVLLDRTFITTLAYGYARSRMKHDSKQYSQLFTYFNDLDKKYHFMRPNRIIYLKVSIPVSISRRIEFSRQKEFRHWFDSRFLEYFAEFYRKNIDNFGMPPPILVDTTKLDKKDLAQKVTKILDAR